MFDVIGYWGVLTITLMSPIFFGLWIFVCQTNKRIEEMGGKEVALFEKVDNFLDKTPIALSLMLASGIHLFMAICFLSKDTKDVSYIGYFSNFSEGLAPIAGYVLVFLAVFVVYDFMLKGYVRITKLVAKLEDKSE